MTATWRVLHGDARDQLATLPERSVQTCVTSPPYFGLRDYGTGKWDGGDPDCDHKKAGADKVFGNPEFNANRPSREKTLTAGYRDVCGRCGATRTDSQIGLETTVDEYVTALVDVFRAVRRVLRDDGTVFLNLGDSFHGGGYANHRINGEEWLEAHGGDRRQSRQQDRIRDNPGLKPKDLIGIPWAVAQALRAPYYTGDIGAERDRVWLAATLDAEGSICGYTHIRADDGTTRTGLHIAITNSSERLLDEAQRIWPASRSEHQRPERDGHLGTRDTWRWIAHGAARKAQLLRELYPYIVVKRKQARIAYAFLLLSVDAKKLARTAEAKSVKVKRAWAVDALSRLNRGEDVDLPAWVGEPPSMFEPGWYLRSEIIWAKPNPMPESVTDRPTRAHEQVFMLAKQPRYFWDADAIREDDGGRASGNGFVRDHRLSYQNADGTARGQEAQWEPGGGRNKRSVWTIASQPYAGAHFATFPPKLIEPCILAGSPERACGECGAPWTRISAAAGLGEMARSSRPQKRRAAELALAAGLTDDHLDAVRATGAADVGQAAATQNGVSAPETARLAAEAKDALGGYFREFGAPEQQTVGFEPSCDHNDPTGQATVLDPFAGSGTTGVVALRHNRSFVGVELNAEYVELARRRICDDAPLFNTHAET